jgi:DnaJ-class molecular chaperone
MEILEIEGEGMEPPSKRVVQRRFRSLLREAHPDHGGITDEAANRIAELTEARRILLA